MAKRYCEMCDAWVSKRECPECGADTRAAARVTAAEAMLGDVPADALTERNLAAGPTLRQVFGEDDDL